MVLCISRGRRSIQLARVAALERRLAEMRAMLSFAPARTQGFWPRRRGLPFSVLSWLSRQVFGHGNLPVVHPQRGV